MIGELSRNGVAQSANRLLAGLRMSVNLELGIEEFVRRADGDREAEPVSSGRDSSCVEPGRLQPCTDGINALGSGSDKFPDL